MRTLRRHLVVRSIGVFFWSCWPPATFGTSARWTSTSFLGLLTCTLRNWNPRPACGTAVKSVRVCLASRQPGVSPQSASRGPVERRFVAVSLALET